MRGGSWIQGSLGKGGSTTPPPDVTPCFSRRPNERRASRAPPRPAPTATRLIKGGLPELAARLSHLGEHLLLTRRDTGRGRGYRISTHGGRSRPATRRASRARPRPARRPRSGR